MALGSLAALAEAALREAGLRLEHWARLRVFYPAGSVTHDAIVASLEDLYPPADAPSPPPPAWTAVPVSGLEPGVALAGQVLACDLSALDADAWLGVGPEASPEADRAAADWAARGAEMAAQTRYVDELCASLEKPWTPKKETLREVMRGLKEFRPTGC